MSALFVLEKDNHRVSFNKLDDNKMVVFSVNEGVLDGRKDIDIETGRAAYGILLKRGYKRTSPSRAEEARYEQEVEDKGNI